MTRQIAIEYIKKTRAQGFSDTALRHELEKSGWPAHEIDLAFIESRATDQKPAVESPPTQFTPRTQPRWEEKQTQTFNAEPKPIDLTKASFARPQDISPKPSATSTQKSLGAPEGTIDGLQFSPPPRQEPVVAEKPAEKPIEPVALRITDVQKIPITPANELTEPIHPKELSRVGTPDAKPSMSLDTKISEVKKNTSEPMIMGVPESQLIRPTSRVESPKQSVAEIKRVEPTPIPVTKPVVAQVVKEEVVTPPQFKPMQEEVVADLVGNGIASAGAGPSVTRSAVLESIGVPPRVRSRRVLAGSLIAVFFFVASGAAAGFWYYQTTLKPQSIVQTALAGAQSMKSYQYDAELKMKVRESEATLGRAVRSFVPPLAGFALGAMTVGNENSTGVDINYTFTLRAKGAVDAHDASHPKSEATLTLGTKDFLAPGFPNANTEFESRLVDDTYYFQVTKLPYFDSAMIDPTIPSFTSADITGRWVSINFETFENDFNNYVKELSELEPSFIGYHMDLQEQQDLITEKQAQDIEKLWSETRLIIWGDEIVREQENGKDRYRVKGTLDKESFKRFVAQSAQLTGGIAGQESQQATDELFSQIGDVEINAWVDKQSAQLARFSIKAGSTLPTDTGVEGVMELHFTADLSDIDKPFSISAPTEHYDVRNLLEDLFAYAREGFASDSADTRDARRLSDLTRLRTALELYKNREGAYPPKLSSLVSEYIATLPTDPLTKKSYSYTRTAKGYVLSAQLEDKKNPILKRDANPANALYDIGPAL